MESNDERKSTLYKYIVIGGGIAGVTCAETLASLCSDRILLITASPLIKTITNFKMVSKVLEQFDIEEQPMLNLTAACPNVTVVQENVKELIGDEKKIVTCEGVVYNYDKLCICTGGKPKVIDQGNPYVLGIRDTETVKVFQQRLANARRVIVVGNGGIATEIVYEIEGCDIIWAIKDASITSTFIDAGAATFFLPHLSEDKKEKEGPVKRLKYSTTDDVHSVQHRETMGSALGPDWSVGLPLHGSTKSSHCVHVEYQVEVKEILTPKQVKDSGLNPSSFPQSRDRGDMPSDWPVYIKLTNDKLYGCDFVVSATGVIPNTSVFTKSNKFNLAEDGGLKVDGEMRTSQPNIYAAGDVCSASWEPASHWIQMRLWSQARQMGAYAAKCMVAHSNNEEITLDFCFELFAHVTTFFNYKVILLGKFNAQGLGQDHNILLRVTKGKEYVKTVMKDGRMYGAILIGETDLEETFENLILNQMDLSAYGEDLLDPNIDIEDYFD